MTPAQRLRLMIDRNRLRLYGGMLGARQLMTSGMRPETYKRRAAEELLCLRENRSVLRMWGRPHSGAAAIKLRMVRECRLRAAQLSRKDPAGRAQNALALVKAMVPHPMEVETIVIDGEVVFPPAAE